MAGKKKNVQVAENTERALHRTGESAHLLSGPFRMPDVRCQTPECEDGALLQSADFFLWFLFFFFFSAAAASLQRSVPAALLPCVTQRATHSMTQSRG